MQAGAAHLALPRQVELFLPTPVQRDEQVCARVSVGQRQAGGAHLLAGGLWSRTSVKGGQWGAGVVQRTLGLAGRQADGILDLICDGHGGCGGW